MQKLFQAVSHTLRSHGAAACGVCPRRALEPCMTQRQREQLEEKMPGWRAVFCAAFPYYVNLPAPPHAISRYAWGMDYHRVLAARLSPAAKLLTESGAHAETLVDACTAEKKTVFCARIVPCRDKITVILRSIIKQRAELHARITENTGIWRISL